MNDQRQGIITPYYESILQVKVIVISIYRIVLIGEQRWFLRIDLHLDIIVILVDLLLECRIVNVIVQVWIYTELLDDVIL